MILEPIASDMPELRAALVASNLPVDDLGEGGRAFFRFRNGEQTVGFGGLEAYRESILVRSLVVLPEARGNGWGQAATELLLRHAAEAGARTAYLLTTDAKPFFERAGFQQIERTAAPAEILATRQSTVLCPSTAALMARKI